MKKMMSLAAMFAVLAYASPASAELKFGGDASVRMRGAFQDSDFGIVNGVDTGEDDLNYAYRLRLKGSADLGDGYFAKILLTTDNAAGGWNTIDTGNDTASLDISQLYFGRMMADSHYMMGRIPLNSVNNPIFDLTLSPTAPVDIPVATGYMDRVYGFNYGRKIAGGEMNATLVVLDNDVSDDSVAEGDGMFNDGYALHLAYKTTLGSVTVEPQAILTLTNAGELGDITPNTFGANMTIPAGDAKIGVSGFYTSCDDLDGAVDYSSYLLRLKGEAGNFTAWIDYNSFENNVADASRDNLFVWAQYNIKVHESAAGSFSLTPTVRYWAQGNESDAGAELGDYSRLRTELVATVSF